MSVFTAHPAMRWLVPGATALAVIGGGVVLRAAVASAEPNLPARTAAQLLTDLQSATLDGLSGTVVQHADLGLPAIPLPGGEGSSDLTSLISGDHTLRVWYSGPDNARVALLGTLGESDIIRAGNDVWTWSSRTRTATHRTLTDGEPTDQTGSAPQHLGSGVPTTPKEASDQVLKAIDPTTVVTTAGSARVAGQAAYELVLAPRDAASLIGQVRLAIDANHQVPLRVQVFGRGASKPAIEVAFTKVTFTRPDAGQFRFAPPPGATVTEQSATTGDPKPDVSRPDAAAPKAQSAGNRPVVIGAGWTSVIAARMPQGDPAASPEAASGAPGRAADSNAGQLASMLSRLPAVNGSWGSGRLLTGKLFSVLVLDDGRVLAGAVAPDRLYQAAADPAAALKATE
jgi:outer membrane lipoprotein-sorting protein